jgi:RND family efflux transporter MFP subunit
MTQSCEPVSGCRQPIRKLIVPIGMLCACSWLAGCRQKEPVQAAGSATQETLTSVGVAKVGRKTLERQLSVSSELVPFQEIDVYAKESGFVHDLYVDYGSRVKKGQLLAVLEIPELEAQLRQDDAMVRNGEERITLAQHELNRVEAQHKVLHLESDRLTSVSKTKPGLVAQQEVDDAQGKDLAAEAAIESANSNLQAVRSDLLAAQAKKEHDQVLFDYAKITAPFAGVVTQRFANLGTLMQAGTSSSTNVLPLVRLSQDDIFRLVIPVPEAYVPSVHIGDPVRVSVAALKRDVPGKVSRFAVDVREDTRTMHTEVDVPNTNRILMPGMYAEATLTLERKAGALSVPLQALNRKAGSTSVYIVNKDNKIEERTIQTGMETATDAEVLSGIEDGDLVVVGDRSSLKPGQDVRPQIVEVMQYDSRKEQ